MSTDNPDEQFWKIADEFILLANEKSQTAKRDLVSASMLFASSRYNAYLLARGSKSLDDYNARKEEVIQYFLQQYEKMLRDNVEDHAVNYDAHRSS
ncbi:DUF3144 domain-containing protein [Pseudoduganella namucuonensis]|uniref:DUF3144 domain-containing protein n=1 Tax=Pseudoduganella namucuonensis TaxID=1035707 RepID=A0A1I7FH31_9BURK|nr:DUF3144 domain-containing protein [Pseudoduganella namucuonensis]SFU35501.1 Protein of unknown function [Pseudoduganella namucuonensis]